MRLIQIKAPAKINLGLRIVSKRNDGFHNLETCFYPIQDLYDLIVFRKSDNFSFECGNAAGINPDDNLIIRAVHLLEEITSRKITVDVKLQKNIPVGAGLGGGSSDAAATLLSLNEMFNLNIGDKSLSSLALLLGSDVPYFLNPKPALAGGRGEKIKLIDFEIDNYILLVNPGIHISTKKAFENISPERIKLDWEKIICGKKWFSFSENITNDFENYIFLLHSEIKNIKEILYEEGALFALMSGTGSTVYGIFNDEKKAMDAASKFPQKYFTFISRPIT